MRHFFTAVMLMAWVTPLALGQAAGRRVVSLNGPWQFQREGEGAWKTVQVPSTMQSHEGMGFHGIGVYRLALPRMDVPAGKRILLECDAVATAAEVFVDGKKLGSHLGPWTAFRVDLTGALEQEGGHELTIRVDERVGHNTQGFLPIIEPHFGGIWQDVKLLVVPEVYVDDLNVLAYGDLAARELVLSVPVHGPEQNVTVRYRERGQGEWISKSVAAGAARIAVADPKAWSVASANLYDLEIETGGGDRVSMGFAFREIKAKGDRILLNGNPLQVRGILNWGYYPPNLAPYPDEARFRKDLEFARASGFNLMKFCLWVPPRRYLELCDEAGMPAWVEYPTWHPQLDQKHLPELQREFLEFFHHDRNHPSVVLRSLTCETGPGADINVIRDLYNLAHKEIPGALIEDDSSWIQWNRVTDFFDDHPYGNNHTWVKTIEGLREYARAHGPKPLVLGEAIAADTWPDVAALQMRLASPRPYDLPGFLEAMGPWRERMEKLCGGGSTAHLREDSLRYALAMRKYQIEAYRREAPLGGYVVSVIRDFPTASMGLLDYAGKPKWGPADWSWQGDTTILLQMKDDRRAFGGKLEAAALVSHMGAAPLTNGKLSLEVVDPGEAPLKAGISNFSVKAGTVANLGGFQRGWPDEPVRELKLRARLTWGDQSVENQWTIWNVPPVGSVPDVWIHPSAPKTIFPDRLRTDHPGGQKLAIASVFDDAVVDFLDNGGRVLMLPNGQEHSFPLSEHWFLRGAPLVPENPLTQSVPRNFWIDLQDFDLAGAVIPDPSWLDMTDPILLLWDTHDLKTVKTHALAFEAGAGKGRILVSTLGTESDAGQYVLSLFLRHLDTDPEPRHSLTNAAWNHLKAKLHAQEIDLTKAQWRFKPDRRDVGLKEKWAAAAVDETWKPIRVGLAWEGQGYENLDGFAWYRLRTQVPESWKEAYLTFDGVDDSYEVYVNGELAGRGGDKARRIDTFSTRLSFNVTRFITPGRPFDVAVRVDDWQGAGGIFRPVHLSTTPPMPELDLIR